MSEKKKYVYFGKRPTNVCYNGVSFPLMPGDVLECLPHFIEAFIPKDQYKEVSPTSSKAAQKPRHSFGKTPMVLRTDPTGGLPMQSTTKMPSKRPESVAPFLRIEDDVAVNPYDLGVDEQPKTELSTFKNISVAEPKRMELDVPTVEDVEEEIAREEAHEDVEVPDEPVVITQDIQVPGKTALRKMTRDEIYNLAMGVKASGAPIKPEMAETFNDFNEESTRGPMFQALWVYFGHDGE